MTGPRPEAAPDTLPDPALAPLDAQSPALAGTAAPETAALPDTSAKPDVTATHATPHSPTQGLAHDIGQGLKDAAANVKETIAGLPANIAAGAVQGLSEASNAAFKATRATLEGGTKLINAVAGTHLDPNLQDTSEAANPFQMRPERVDKVFGKPGNIVDSFVRGIGNYSTLSALTGGLGGEAKGGAAVARFAINTAKAATLMTIGSDPRSEDFITTHAQQLPGAAGRFATAMLGASPSDPNWMAYAKAEGRNILTAATMNGAIKMAGAVWAAKMGQPEVLDGLARQKPEPDAATITVNPNGTASIAGEGDSMTMPSEGAAEVEVAQRNISAKNAELLQQGPAAYAKGYRAIAQAMTEGKGPRALSALIREHDLQVPHGGDPVQIQEYITGMGKLLKAGGDDISAATAAIDPMATPEGMTRRFAQWFGSSEDLPEKVRGAQLYLQVLGRQASSAAEALGLSPDSPAAQANVDQMWDTMMQIYAPLSGGPMQRFGIKAADEMGTVSRAAEKLGFQKSPAEVEGESAIAAAREPTTQFGESEGGTPREAQGPQATEQMAAGQSASKLTPEARDEFARMLRIANGDPRETLEAVRQSMIRMSFADQGLTPETARAEAEADAMSPAKKAANSFAMYRANSLISSVGTADKIVISQLGLAAKLPVEMVGGGGIRALKGLKPWDFDLDEVKGGAALANEGVDVATGFIKYLHDNVTTALRAFRSGHSEIDPRAPIFPDGRINPHFYQLGEANWVYNVVGAPSRLHTSITEFTKSMVYRSVIRAQALRDAAAQGLSAEETADAVESHMQSAFDPTGKAIGNADALLEARQATLTEPLDNVLLGRDVHSLMEKHPLLRTELLPFQTIGTNVFKQQWAMFPGLARFQSAVQRAYQEGGDAKARAQANQVIGASILAMGYHLASKGVLSGRGPSDPELRKQREQNQTNSYEMRVGNYKLSLDRWEPFGVLAEMGATAQEGIQAHADQAADKEAFGLTPGGNKYTYLKNHPVCQSLRQIADFCDATRGTFSEDGARTAAAIVASLAQKAESNSWLTSMTTVMEPLMSPSDPESEGKLQKWAENEAATMVPWSKFWSSINSDPIHREARGFVENLRSRTQGFSESLEASRNLFGEKYEQPPGFVDFLPGNHVNPFVTGKVSGSDSTQAKLLGMGRAMPMPKSTTPGVGGLPAVDWKDRGTWDQVKGADGQSPWDRTFELMATPMYNGKTAREMYQDLLANPEFKKLPMGNSLGTEGPAFDQVSKLYHRLWQAAAATMMQEPRYANFAQAVNANQQTVKATKQGGLDIAHGVYKAMMNRNAPGTGPTVP